MFIYSSSTSLFIHVWGPNFCGCLSELGKTRELRWCNNFVEWSLPLIKYKAFNSHHQVVPCYCKMQLGYRVTRLKLLLKNYTWFVLSSLLFCGYAAAVLLFFVKIVFILTYIIFLLLKFSYSVFLNILPIRIFTKSKAFINI